MKQELQNALEKDFPSFFRGLHESPQQSCMAFGIECGDGWEPLIRRTCKKIKKMVPKDFCWTQIKEKFGGLRLYCTGCSEKAYKVISKAEKDSYKTCEVCGTLDNVETKGGWVMTLCKICREIR